MKVTILFQNSLSDNNEEFFKKKKKQLNLQSKLKSLKLEIPFSLDGYNFFFTYLNVIFIPWNIYKA